MLAAILLYPKRQDTTWRVKELTYSKQTVLQGRPTYMGSLPYNSFAVGVGHRVQTQENFRTFEFALWKVHQADEKTTTPKHLVRAVTPTFIRTNHATAGLAVQNKTSRLYRWRNGDCGCETQTKPSISNNIVAATTTPQIAFADVATQSSLPTVMVSGSHIFYQYNCDADFVGGIYKQSAAARTALVTDRTPGRSPPALRMASL